MHELNSTLVRILWNTLPYRSLQTHALVTGDHLYHLVLSEPLIYTSPEFKCPDRAKEPDSTYSRVTEHYPIAPCGNVVPEDLEKLRWLGKEVWKSQIETKEPIERTGAAKEVKSLVQEIHEEMEKSWSGISDNIKAIYSGRALSKPGSKDSYFATMLFANSEVRTLGYYVFDNLLKIAATHPEFNLQHLIVLYRELVSAPAEFLGYVGTEFLRNSYRKIDDLIVVNIEKNTNQSEAREDLLAMVSVLAQYINLLNAQILLLFL
ncbi:hypothetical protein N7448_011021 [Penicillium atrosanguineum]|nr:hypothetical protein N7448_011021 [Penicillium atrosanguineum]